MMDKSYGYLDREEQIPAWISNMFKDPFEVSIDAEDQRDDGGAPDKEIIDTQATGQKLLTDENENFKRQRLADALNYGDD